MVPINRSRLWLTPEFLPLAQIDKYKIISIMKNFKKVNMKSSSPQAHLIKKTGDTLRPVPGSDCPV